MEKIKKDVEKFISELKNKNLVELLPEKINKNIFLYKFQNGCFTYYINDGKKLLIDAGMFIKNPVDLIIVTHCHFDHILFLNELREFHKCKIACGKKDKEAIESLNEKVLLNQSPKKFLPIKIDKVLKEGDIIKTNNYSFKVLETPGHTEGSISLFEERKSILFSGDAWFGNDNQGKWVYPTGSKKESRKTLEKLKKLNPKILCPGHWGIIKEK